MELQHVNVKIYVDGEVPFGLHRFVEVFHRWVSEQPLDELLIDVADYSHVPAGPGIVLIGHEADYSLDHTDGRYGLRYNRKQAVEGSNQDRLVQAFRSAASVCSRLEAEFASSGLKFSRREFEIFVNDRALAPNTPETFAVCQPQIAAFLKERLALEVFHLEHDVDPRKRFRVFVRSVKGFDPARLA